MTKILGQAQATAHQMATYLLSKNPNPQINMPVKQFCQLFLDVAAQEGVRGDGLFAQSCKETGNFKFKGTVTPDQNNYGGLGTLNAETKGAYFPDEATGVLAQAQHAKGYATDEELCLECVDPRYKVLIEYDKIGTAQHWEELGGKWAIPGYDTKLYACLQDANDAEDSYGYHIVNILNDILEMPKEDKEMGKIIVLDAGHDGEYNRSPVNPAYYESDMNWDLHMDLKKELEEQGAEVRLTRSSKGQKLAVQDRGKSAEGAAVAISIHSNASSDETKDYVAVYCMVDDDTTDIDNISRELAEVLAPVIADVMGTSQGFKVLTRKSGNDRNGDGIMNDNYYGFLNGARLVGVPALILEHSFHTNLRMTNWLLDDNNLARLAKAEAAAIAKHYGLAKEQEPASDTLYRVQVGAFSKPENAENMKARLEADGFDTYIVKVNGWYKVQVGAYSKKSNAEAMLAKIRPLGYDSYITTYGGQGVASVEKKSVEEVAKEVIAGKWGNGTARKAALEAAGYDFATVQDKVNELLK